MGGAVKSESNSFFKSKYANLEEVIKVVKEQFSANGLSFVQFPVSGEGTAGVETIIMHESGEFISNQFLLKCSKSDPQGMGSAITYARRYGLQSACGIPSEDDDGNAASAPTPQERPADVMEKVSTAKTLDELNAMWTALTTDMQKRADVKGAFTSHKETLNK